MSGVWGDDTNRRRTGTSDSGGVESNVELRAHCHRIACVPGSGHRARIPVCRDGGRAIVYRRYPVLFWRAGNDDVSLDDLCHPGQALHR